MKIKKLDDVFKNTVKSNSIHEAVVLIESGCGSFHYSNSYGDKNIDSPIIIASITKLFTTACILILYEQKKLSLTDKICSFFEPDTLKGLHTYQDIDFVGELTIMHLLSQTSGLPDAYEETKSSLKNKVILQDTAFSFHDFLKHTKALKPHFAPHFNNRAYYADINFDILGKIIEKVLDLPLSKVFETYIFNPLGLTRTYLPTSENDFIPHIFYNDKKLYRPKFVISSGASGGAISTAKELMIFIKAFFQGSLFDINILNLNTKYRRLQLQMTPIRYGLGHMQISLGNISTLFKGEGQLIGHSGSTGSFAFYHPTSDLFFVGDVNQISKPALPVRLLMQLSIAVK